MISKEKAIQIVRATLADDMDVIRKDIVEKDYGWVLFPITKDYIETGDPMALVIGSGGVLVEKTDGNTYEFGSAYSTEQNLRIYELGYLQYDNWDIEVTSVEDEAKTIEHLARLGMSYVVPEEAHGTVWKIPESYSKEQLGKEIKSLPARFNIGNLYFKWEEIEAFKSQSDFEYQLFENKGYVNIGGPC